MLELSKQVLIRVSFDKILFQKELKKARKWINNQSELMSFRNWCLLEFGHLYPVIIKKILAEKKG